MNLEKGVILVIGGAGFIGSHVTNLLIDRGFEVVIMDDLSTGKLEYINEKSKFSKGDVRYKKDIKNIIKEHDPKIIINFSVRCLMESLTRPEDVHQTNVNGVLNILEVIRELNRKIRFIQISSSEAYGSAHHVPQLESHPMNPTTPYGASKAAADMYVKSYNLCYNFPTMIVRPFNCYGPNMRLDIYAAVMYAFFKRLMNGEKPIIFGDGLQTRDFTFISDTSRGIADAIFCDKLLGHVVHIASGKETSILEIAHHCNKIFNRDPDEIIFKDPRQGEVRRHLADISRAKKFFNYAPKIDIEEGIRRTFKWLRDNYSDKS